MKINRIITIPILMLIMISITGCNKFLDEKPHTVSPVDYFNSQSQLDSYVIPFYMQFPTADGGKWDLGKNALSDNNTDNQTSGASNFWMPEDRKVAQSGNWDWKQIYNINYFFQEVLPKVEAGLVAGSADMINNNIGEMYFFRAMLYFNHLKKIGDSPIILETIVDQLEPLLEASVRQPRNMVARQILKDLDLAIGLLKAEPVGGSNRISKNVAWLFKSRVALYEASWEENFKGTAFVPNGEGWPGKATHPSFAYNADDEINFFLDQALEAAKIVADAVPELTANPADYDYKNSSKSGLNPYYEMWGTTGTGLNSVPEVLLCRSYDLGAGVFHHMIAYLADGGQTGYNNQYMENFLMRNGLPIYAAGSGYNNDDSKLENIKVGRDSRLQLFVQASGEILTDTDRTVNEIPAIIGGAESRTTTGFVLRKRAAIDEREWATNSGSTSDIIFRSVEANLNYIEAYYMKHKSIGGDAATYWRAIRRRANVDENYQKTIDATIMTEEAKVDLAAYTAGRLVDATLYNIRRERRSEFIAEGYRWDDLKRYRALDQLISERVFVPQGFNLHDEYVNSKHDDVYDSVEEESLLVLPPADGANISANIDFTVNGGELMEGKYLYPLRVRTKEDNNKYYDGYKFHPSHYLDAIGASHFVKAKPVGDDAKTVIYQNPGWGVIAGIAAVAVPGFN